MKKILFAAVIFIIIGLVALLYPQPDMQAQSVQQTLPLATNSVFMPWLAKAPPIPTATETATTAPTQTATATATATEVATQVSTSTPTSLPTPPNDVYFNIAVLQGCEPNAGVTYVQGTTYVNGTPQSGYLVAFSYAADGPIVAFVQSGPHPGYEGWSPGFYSHILQSNGPRQGDWHFWIMDETGQRISDIGYVHTHGEAGAGKCQQAVIDFDSRPLSNQSPTTTATPTGTATATTTPATPSAGGATFRLIEQRLWDVVENGGRLDGDSVHCGEKHELQVKTYDAGGALLNGVAVQGIWTNEIQITGQQGKGEGTVEYVLWGSGEDVKVVKDAGGSDVTSDVAAGNTTRPREISNEQLIGARYCKDEQSCQAFKDNFGCTGHFSWTVKFQRQN